MFQLRFWYYKEKVEDNFVKTVAIRCINFAKETNLSTKTLNTNYNEIITQFVLNEILHHVVMSWIIETNKNYNMILTKIIQIG